MILPDPTTVCRAAFVLLALPHEQRSDALKRLIYAIVASLIERRLMSPIDAVNFTKNFTNQMIDAMAEMPPSETRH